MTAYPREAPALLQCSKCGFTVGFYQRGVEPRPWTCWRCTGEPTPIRDRHDFPRTPDQIRALIAEAREAWQVGDFGDYDDVLDVAEALLNVVAPPPPMTNTGDRAPVKEVRP